MTGRSAPAMAASMASATGSASAGTVAPVLCVLGQTIALLSTRSSRRSDGKLKWTGPGRPDVAIRIGLVEIASQRGRGCSGPGSLGDGSRHIGLPDFLEASAADFPCGRMPRQQHHRQLGAEGSEQSANRVCVAGPAGDQSDTGVAGETSPRIRHVDRSRFVAYMHEIETSLERGVKDRHDVIARKRKHARAAETSERLSDDIGAS